MAPRPDPHSVTASRVAAEEPWSVVSAAGARESSLSPTSVLRLVKPQAQDEERTVVLVDPLSTGVMLQKRLLEAGYNIIVVWSDRTQPIAREKHFQKTSPEDRFAGIIVHDGNIHRTLHQILAITQKVYAVMCGSEHGVLLEDAIADGLNAVLGTTNLRSSGLETTMTKVDKHAQANLLREAGLQAVHETLARCEDDVRSFLERHKGQQKFVVKPQTGAGSVGVTLCESPQAVWDAYYRILAGEHKAHCSEKYKHYHHAGVLLQEFLEGTEFIVNSVIRNGEIKTTAMFQYDKRPYNGAAFVCFSKELLVIGDDPKLVEILEYAENVLRAVRFRNGAIHAEIMYTSRGPVLVELNCRLHGGNAQWVHPAQACMGYNQLGVFMDAYLNEGQNEFKNIPSRPIQAKKYCHQVKMRSHIEGVLEGVLPAQLLRIQSLPSYLEHFFAVKPGDHLLRTVDMPSVPGEVTLVHEDRSVLARDYEELNSILREGIFKVVDERAFE